MKSGNCYMPSWPNGKLVKRGHYCNWESVLAHVYHMHDTEKSIETEQLDAVVAHVTELIGPLDAYCTTLQQNHYSQLEHFTSEPTDPCFSDRGSEWTSEQYHDYSSRQYDPINAVKISATGDVFDIHLTPKEGRFKFEQYLSLPYMYGDAYHKAASLTASRRGLPKDRELTAFYWPAKNGLEKNLVASGIFKFEIHGDVLLVLQTKEASFRPRERFVAFTKQQFDELFTPSQRKKQKAKGLTVEEFAVVREGMQEFLNVFEAGVSASAERPQDLGRGAVMPPSSGAELARVARLLGHEPPEKPARPPSDAPPSAALESALESPA